MRKSGAIVVMTAKRRLVGKTSALALPMSGQTVWPYGR